MLNTTNLTWEDALVEHEDAEELDRNRKVLLERSPGIGGRMEVQQLDLLRKLKGVGLLSQSSGIHGDYLQIHNLDTITDCMDRIVHTARPVGFGDITSPVIINQKYLLKTGQDKTKTLKALMGM